MKRLMAILFVGVIGAAASAVFISTTTSGNDDKFARSANPIPNRYIVRLADDNFRSAAPDSREVAAAANDLAADYGAVPDLVYFAAMKGFAAEMSPKAAMMLANDPRVLMVEEDGIVRGMDAQPNAPWGLDRIDQRILPMDGSYNHSPVDTTVHVYVIDSGIRASHMDFGGRATADFDGIIDGQNGNDCNGHGTHVAGTVGGNTSGVAKGVRLHGVRVLGCGNTGTVSTVLAGVDWVAANRQSPAVVNMSLGSGVSELLDFVINQTIESGITFVVSAGNSTSDACNVSPARIPNAITVGATTQQDGIAWFSNFGSCVDIMAPGFEITSAWIFGDQSYKSMNGTSMAAPHVTGMAARYLFDNPTATPTQVTNHLLGNATVGMIGGLDQATPNLLLYGESPADSCSGTSFQGYIPRDATAYHSASGFSAGGGTFSAVLTIFDSLSAEITLQRRSGSSWTDVASTTDEILTLDAPSGTYRWKVTSLKGGSDYSLCSTTP